jgi:hypothetical protein
MLGCGLDLVLPLSCRRTSVPCTLPTPALSDFVTSTSDYLAPSLERNNSLGLHTLTPHSIKSFDKTLTLLRDLVNSCGEFPPESNIPIVWRLPSTIYHNHRHRCLYHRTKRPSIAEPHHLTHLCVTRNSGTRDCPPPRCLLGPLRDGPLLRL